ncbi:hypothetical protein STENM327S_06116 [Streptomyces tendae]
MPTNCWKTDRPIPIQTIGLKKKLPPRRSLKEDFSSRCMACSISVTRASKSTFLPSTSSRIFLARSRLPTEIRKRGDSGMAKDSRPYRMAGTTMTPSMTCQASRPISSPRWSPPAAFSSPS